MRRVTCHWFAGIVAAFGLLAIMPAPAGAAVQFGQAINGSGNGSFTFTLPIDGGTDQTYVMCISVRSDAAVTNVTGGAGLTWTPHNVHQCSDDGETSAWIFTAQGSPGAAFTPSIFVDSGPVVAVCLRYSGVDSIVDPTGQNPNGEFGNCNSATDTALALLTLTSTIPGSVHVVAVARRKETVTATNGYTGRQGAIGGGGGPNGTSIYAYDKTFNPAGTEQFQANLSNQIDWATAGVVLTPAAAGGGGGGGCVRFTDDFEDDTITGWTSIGSEPLVETGGVLQTPEGNNQTSHYSIDSGAAWTDYSISADVKSVDNDVSGITFRIQDHDNIYLFRQEFGEGGDQWDCQLQKYVAAVRSDLAPPVPNFGTDPGQVDDVLEWYNMKVVVSGTNIKCYIDDVLKFDVDDSTYSQGTGGLWLAAQLDSEFDNVVVEEGSCAMISSDSNQIFGVDDSATAISPITVTDDTPAQINFIDDIRIRIPAAFNMTWDTSDTSAVISGSGASNVSTTVSYPDNKTLVIDVTPSSFADGDEITVSGLSFTGFSAESAQDNLELDVDNDALVHATDDKTIQIGPNGNTYYVRETGSDAADGLSAVTAWGTIDKAANTMVAGDWVYVGAGVLPYDEQVTPTNDGTAADPIRFIADTSGARTGDAGTVEITESSGSLDVVRVEDDDYIEFIGFKITGGDIGIRWLNSVGGLVDQCEVTATGDRGISAETGSELTVTGCDVHHVTSEGIYPWGGATLTVTETDIHDNPKYGFRVVDATTTLTASRCRIADNNPDGVRIEAGNVTMINCLVTGAENKAIYILPGPATTTLWHCTIDNNGHDGFKQDDGTAVIRNCIISNNGQAGIELLGGTVDHTFNLFWNNPDGLSGTIEDITERSDADPLFVSAADRHLQSGSPAIDAGTDSTSVTSVDFDGDTRPTAADWDIGYDEYGSATAGTPRIVGWREVEPW
jgi:hypothetical protein